MLFIKTSSGSLDIFDLESLHPTRSQLRSINLTPPLSSFYSSKPPRSLTFSTFPKPHFTSSPSQTTHIHGSIIPLNPETFSFQEILRWIQMQTIM